MRSDTEYVDTPSFTYSGCDVDSKSNTIEFIDAADSTTVLSSTPPGVAPNYNYSKVIFTTTSTTLADTFTALGRYDFIVRHTKSVENSSDSSKITTFVSNMHVTYVDNCSTDATVTPFTHVDYSVEVLET